MEEKKISHVICPFCCHKFRTNEADFRLNEACIEKMPPKRTKKKVKKSPEPHDFGKEIDEKLYRYNVDILKYSDEEALKNSLMYQSITLEEKEGVSFLNDELEKYGFVQQIMYTSKDEITHRTDKRLCPNCHNVLPVGYGLRETLLISIIGDARAGKSIYLTMLINELENNADFVSKLNFIGDKTVRDSIFESYQKPLLRDYVLVDSTKRKKMPPFAYNYWYQYRGEDGMIKENTLDIIFYDIAGEDLRDDSGIRQNGFNIKDSSGLIFLVDPTNFQKLKDSFMIKDRSLIDAIPGDNSIKNIFSAMYNYFLGMDKEKSPIPVALTISKADLFKYLELRFFDNKPESRIQNILEGESHKGYLNVRSAKALNLEVRELLSYLNEEPVLNNAVGCFKNVNCFAVSSLGKKPIIENTVDPETNETIEKGYIDGQLLPFRVKEPFYWILFKNGFLCKSEDGVYFKNGESQIPSPKRTFIQMLLDMIEMLLSYIKEK